jgi:hypothetical protein
VRISVAKAKYDHERRFLNELAMTCRDIGHDVTVSYLPKGDLHIQWGGRPHRRTPTLYCELGWLPRWHYQVSHSGINHQHHRQGEPLPVLTPQQEAKARLILADTRKMVGAPHGWGHTNAKAPVAEIVHNRFVLAPLQMESDTNMASVPPELRTNQGFVDAVTDHVAETLGAVRIIFKQHPNSRARPQLSLSMRRKGDKVWPHRVGPVHGYLKHPGCTAVVTANSNVANDALLWGVPTMAMGGGIWPEGVFLESLADIDLWDDSEAFRLAYVYWLHQVQWSYKDARSLRRVSQAIDEVA